MVTIRLIQYRLSGIKTVLTILFCSAILLVNAQIPDSLIRPLKGGKEVYSHAPIYQLPYKPGTRHLLVQGWQSNLSHKGEVAQDFRMPVGTAIYAARSGVVIQVKSDGTTGGLKEEKLGEGNNVVIMHSDSTFAGYWHLKHSGVLVEIGDSIIVGQKIGLSGNTGYSAFPHLHFMVFHYKEGFRKTIPVRFKTRKGLRYLRPGKRYKSIRL